MRIAVLWICLTACLGGCAGTRTPAPAAVVPFALEDDHILVTADVNGAGPYRFIVDSGAPYSVVAAHLASGAAPTVSRRLPTTMYGFGPATRPAHVLDGMYLTLEGNDGAGRTVTLPLKFVLETTDETFEPLFRAAGFRFDGILGYDLFRRYVVEIDYDARVLRLHEPTTYRYRGHGALVKLERAYGGARVPVRITPRPGDEPIDCLLVLDTGAAGDAHFSGPMIERHGIERRITTRPAFGVGAGGIMTPAAGRLAALHLGPYELKDVFAHFSRGRDGGSGANATGDGSGDAVRSERRRVDGVLGGGVLRRFTVVVAYPYNAMILVPGRTFASPRKPDQSGLGFMAEGDDLNVYRVALVMPDTPAAEAGIRVGDVLVAIDGRLATRMTLEEVEDAFRAGASRRVTVRRAGEMIDATVRLRPLF